MSEYSSPVDIDLDQAELHFPLGSLDRYTCGLLYPQGFVMGVLAGRMCCAFLDVLKWGNSLDLISFVNCFC